MTGRGISNGHYYAGVQYRRRPALYMRLVAAAGEPLPPELAHELQQAPPATTYFPF